MSAPVTDPTIVILRPGETVSVSLSAPSSGGICQLGGEVIAVDHVGVRVKPTWQQEGSLPYRTTPRRVGEIAVPWSRIARVSVPAAGGER